MATLHPMAQAILDQIHETLGQAEQIGPLTESALVGLRAQAAAQAHQTPAEPVPGVVTEDVTLPVAGATITARVHRPSTGGPYPLHVYCHGGAFIFGTGREPAEDALLGRRALDAAVVVVTLDYRLAPEHRFPTGIEDAYTGLVWAVDHAAELGSDPTRVSVGGSSSGGNFAAALALMSRDRGGPRLLAQLLEIPGTDLTKSSYGWREGPIQDTPRALDRALVDFYLSRPEDIVHPYASPLFAPNLVGVAPAYVMSAEFDPRRDESEAYVTRLRDAQVPAIARTMRGHVHGSYALYAQWERARAWVDEANAVLRHINAHPVGDPFADLILSD